MGVIDQSKPAHKTSNTPGVVESDWNGASQSPFAPRFSQYAPTNTNTTPNKPRRVGSSFSKTAEMKTVKTGPNVNNGVTSEASANFNERAEARCASAFNSAEPHTPHTNSTSTCGNVGFTANVSNASSGNAKPMTLHTTTTGPAALNMRL